jgi:hypothetical protein
MMNYKNTFEQMHEDMDEIKALLTKFQSSDTGEIPAIEIDIALGKLRDMYEMFSMMKKSFEPEEEQAERPQETEKQEPHVSEPDNNSSAEEPAQDRMNEIELEVEHEAASASEAEKIEEPEEMTGQESEDEKVKKKEKHAGKIFADRFSAPENQINETIGRNKIQTDLSSRIQSKPITDINRALGVNDKFLFAKELFNGDKARFKETIDIVNNANDFDEAMNYINENFAWDMDNPYAKMFIDLINRKYNT